MGPNYMHLGLPIFFMTVGLTVKDMYAIYS